MQCFLKLQSLFLATVCERNRPSKHPHLGKVPQPNECKLECIPGTMSCSVWWIGMAMRNIPTGDW